MDNRSSSDPYFNPQQPGTVCIAIDRYGHYLPSSENALRFLQQGDVETGVRRFPDDNVKASALCTYVPDVTLLVFRFQSMKNVPPPERDRRPTVTYATRSSLSLPRKTGCGKGNHPCRRGIFHPDQRNAGLLRAEKVPHAGERLCRIPPGTARKENIYRLQPEYVLPLR